MATGVSLRPAREADRGYAADLLDTNGLPTSDLDAALSDLFVCEDHRGRAVGIGGIEQHGRTALLRSVAIDPAHRGAGYGTALCEGLLERARTAGVTDVYLLTTDAAGYFSRLGFERADREHAPPAIQATTEFSELCPDTATCMHRQLDA